MLFAKDARGKITYNGRGPGGSVIEGDPGFEEARAEQIRFNESCKHMLTGSGPNGERRPGDPGYEESHAAFLRDADKRIRAHKRWVRRTGITSTLGLIWQSIWRMGMYSEDPYTARIATVHTVQQEVVNQRQMMAQQRLDDQAREEERMRMFARVMADELATRINR